jgi:hypothetical protein
MEWVWVGVGVGVCVCGSVCGCNMWEHGLVGVSFEGWGSKHIGARGYMQYISPVLHELKSQ